MASDTGGVKSFSIQGRLYRERERLTSMTEAERALRKQWIRDQNIHEPKVVPEIYQELYHPIRRAYKAPLDAVFTSLTPVLGDNIARGMRAVSGKLLMGLLFVYAGTYYLKYNGHDWTRKGGWRVTSSRPAVVPGDKGFPYISTRTTGADYGARGFKDSPI